MADLQKIALLYDFDKTLTIDNMQNQGFLQSCGFTGKEGISQFWDLVEKVVVEDGMDRYIAFMYCMLQVAHKANIRVTENFLKKCAKTVSYFPGVETWFERINGYAKKSKWQVEHYIISSGNIEIIQGTSIARFFKKIYASSYHYDKNGEADWPSCCINYTNKTQFLYRIKKQKLDINDDDVNKHIDDTDSIIPFSNMIYIGDSDTDIPCMEIVKHSGGHSICVYPASKSGEVSKKAAGMMRDQRINYYSVADYTAGGKLENLVMNIIDKITIDAKLKALNAAQSLNV